MPVNSCLSIQHLSVERGQKRILQDVSLTIQPGEFVSILGPNGAGKSTLLKTMLGFYPPAQGEIFLMGQPLPSASPKQRAQWMAYVPQSAVWDEFCTVSEFVALGRYPHQAGFQMGLPTWLQKCGQAPGVGDAEIVQALLAQAGLASFAHRKMGTLSGGEQQKVLITAALAQEPKVLLLDEPTTFLDPKNQTEMHALLREIHARHRMTIVVITHDINAALHSSTRLIGLKRGGVLFDGPPEAWQDVSRWEALYDVPFQMLEAPNRDVLQNAASQTGLALSEQDTQRLDGLPSDAQGNVDGMSSVRFFMPAMSMCSSIGMAGVTDDVAEGLMHE